MIRDRKLAYGVIPVLWIMCGLLVAIHASALALAADLAAAERAFALDSGETAEVDTRAERMGWY